MNPTISTILVGIVVASLLKERVNRFFSRLNLKPVGFGIVNGNTIKISLSVTNTDPVIITLNAIKGKLLYRNKIIAFFNEPIPVTLSANETKILNVFVKLNYQQLIQAAQTFVKDFAQGIKPGIQVVADIVTPQFTIPVNTTINPLQNFLTT